MLFTALQDPSTELFEVPSLTLRNSRREQVEKYYLTNFANANENCFV